MLQEGVTLEMSSIEQQQQQQPWQQTPLCPDGPAENESFWIGPNNLGYYNVYREAFNEAASTLRRQYHIPVEKRIGWKRRYNNYTYGCNKYIIDKDTGEWCHTLYKVKVKPEYQTTTPTPHAPLQLASSMLNVEMPKSSVVVKAEEDLQRQRLAISKAIETLQGFIEAIRFNTDSSCAELNAIIGRLREAI